MLFGPNKVFEIPFVKSLINSYDISSNPPDNGQEEEIVIQGGPVTHHIITELDIRNVLLFIVLHLTDSRPDLTAVLGDNLKEMQWKVV